MLKQKSIHSLLLLASEKVETMFAWNMKTTNHFFC